MFVFSGWGFVIVPLCFLLGAGLGGAIDGAIESGTGQPSKVIGLLLGGIIGSAICWFWGNKINNADDDQVLVDKRTGREVVLKSRHTLMFIPVQYYAFLLLLAFAVMALGGGFPDK
jgi:outer membrane lipoprotein SlyB